MCLSFQNAFFIIVLVNLALQFLVTKHMRINISRVSFISCIKKYNTQIIGRMNTVDQQNSLPFKVLLNFYTVKKFLKNL